METVQPNETGERKASQAMARIVPYSAVGSEVELGLDEGGNGLSVVLLPALSSISTRQEMRPLFDRLKSQVKVATVDWPGFGEGTRPRVNWTPDILSAFLHWFLTEVAEPHPSIVAAGHAATYALYEAAHHPGTIDRLVLIAPTWRGPLPTMTNGQRPWFARVRCAVDTPILGEMLYRLNVSRPVVSMMAREHVYSDPNWLTKDRMSGKLAVTHARRARYGSVRFVTGGLDRVDDRAAFLDLAAHANVPILVVYGEETPPKSRAEMEALAGVPGVRVQRLPKGKLAVHEEFPDVVADLVLPFLSNDRQP